MRGIRGWIINLLDGLGPPPSTVHVQARVESTGTDLDLVTHRLGGLQQAHVVGGSVSPHFADNIGHFGWDMELGPGLIDVNINPTDPQNEYRRRFPDESSQIGKAYMTDLERVAWVGGQNGLAWNAISGGNQPGGNWSQDATLSWNFGNGSIAAFGQGGDAGRFVLRRFIGFLGGVPFTVELGDLLVPVAGETAAPPNTTSVPRYDVFNCVMEDDPSSTRYGKQSIERVQGVPGAGIPSFQPETSTLRRMPLHALKMNGGSSVYSNAVDLRHWLNPPPGVLDWPYLHVTRASGSFQSFVDGGSRQEHVPALVNSNFGDFLIPLGDAYTGIVTLEVAIDMQDLDPSKYPGSSFLGGIASVSCRITGVDEFGNEVSGQLAFTPAGTELGETEIPYIAIGAGKGSGPQLTSSSVTWVFTVYPYAAAGALYAAPAQTSRTYSRVRVRFYYSIDNFQYFQIQNQRATIDIRRRP